MRRIRSVALLYVIEVIEVQNLALSKRNCLRKFEIRGYEYLFFKFDTIIPYGFEMFYPTESITFFDANLDHTAISDISFKVTTI